MKLSPAGLRTLKSFEGCCLTAYRCKAGRLTIGYGSTGAHVCEGKTITQAEAEALLLRDAARFEACINRGVKVPLEQHQFDALVLWAFNVGIDAALGSHLLGFVNDGRMLAAANAFLVWKYITVEDSSGNEVKVVDPVLVARRGIERRMFLADVVGA